MSPGLVSEGCTAPAFSAVFPSVREARAAVAALHGKPLQELLAASLAGQGKGRRKYKGKKENERGRRDGEGEGEGSVAGGEGGGGVRVWARQLGGEVRRAGSVAALLFFF